MAVADFCPIIPGFVAYELKIILHGPQASIEELYWGIFDDCYNYSRNEVGFATIEDLPELPKRPFNDQGAGI